MSAGKKKKKGASWGSSQHIHVSNACLRRQTKRPRRSWRQRTDHLSTMTAELTPLSLPGYPRFFRGHIMVKDENDQNGAYAKASQAAQAAASHVNSRKDTQVVIFADASLDPHQHTNTSAGVGVAFRRHDPSLELAGAPNGMVHVWAGWPVWADETLNTTGAETLALSFAMHVGMVELYRLEGRLKEEQQKERRQAKEEKKARDIE
ncbi:hypothetical protein QBC45DRAFT_417272 [Copromyces sp. CBS 386.78]|nr:hypothetical protein QBC45DRAFT_417272 [Copromyces sp. CBS 386.78]